MEITIRHTTGSLFLLLLFTASALSAVNNTDEEQTTLRNTFLAAEKALGKDKTAYRTLKARLDLHSYPLTPYLELKEMLGRLSVLKSDEVEIFLNRYQETPLAHKLRSAWLKHLAKKKRWWTYRAFYTPTTSTSRRCTYYWSLFKTGHKAQAMKRAEEIWLTGSSQPKACDPLLKALQQSDRFSTKLVWQRINLTMERRNGSLARYLERFLPEQEKGWLKQWLDIRSNPARVVKFASHDKSHPYHDQVLYHGLKWLARKDLPSALTAWNKIKDKEIPPELGQQIKRALAFRMAREDHKDVIDWMDRVVPAGEDLKYTEKRLRTALEEQRWDKLLAWLESAPESFREKENWRYWHAHATAESGEPEEADALFKALARERSYHGFLAADRVGVDYNLDNTPLELPPAEIAQLAEHPGLQRAKELLTLNRLLDARREWQWATRRMERSNLQAAAKLAQSWNWHDRAIFTLARTGYWDDLELRFPLEHDKQISNGAKRQNIDKAWVFAVVRQESAFSRDAISPVGAMGLMQLMPRTAKSVAKKAKQPKPAKRDLLIPKTNIRLGTGYLREVLNQLGNNPVLATAAYNAGPHRVKSWLPEEVTDAHLWIENIPFTETRKYTQRVLAYSVIYEQRLGRQPVRLSQKLQPILPGKQITSTGITLSSSKPAG
ncbi:MAG: transglycosylase SLT domain-containing protein [Candidatus Sedimenticola sp. PURPLELP]